MLGASSTTPISMWAMNGNYNNYSYNVPDMERRETGTLIPQSQRLSQNLQFGSAPSQSGFASMSSPRKMQHPFQNQRQSPSMDSPDLRFGDSPRSGSYNQEMLDDLIIDEILSLEDEQRRTSGKTQPISVSYSCADNLTQLGGSNARPIPGAQSGGSGHSGSPIAIGGSAAFRQVVSSSAPTSSMDMDQMMLAAQDSDSDYYRDRRKKDIHNMIERRRRYNINDRIKELGHMLPKGSSDSVSRDMKLNKGTILKASCDYIRQLQRERENLAKFQQHTISVENMAKQYADRVRELEEVLSRQGIQVPPGQLPPLPKLAERPIKQEPEDSSPNQTPCGSLSSSGFLAQLSDGTAAMQIASPACRGGPMPSKSQPDNFFNNSSPSEYASNNWQQFQDLIMDDITPHPNNPLFSGGDPLISQAGAHPSPHLGSSQMSPDIQWDQAGFSPDVPNCMQHQQMDY
ncbi:unnamed protein product [Auanema sp. JU1783]|nr:unnamed protein product [Auanema sp. JU1783]